MTMLSILLLLFPALCASDYMCGTEIAGCASYDRVYSHGEYLENSCLKFQCLQGTNGFQWNAQGWHYYECDYCSFFREEILTFDKASFKMTRSCNYTMAQPQICSEGPGTYNPNVAIHSQFGSCYDARLKKDVACYKKLTFKANENTVLTVDFGSSVVLTINGENIDSITTYPQILCDGKSRAYPFIAHVDDNKCIYMQGPMFGIFVCPSVLIMQAKKTEKNKLGGLCGLYSGNETDDFLTRNCEPETQSNVQLWADSWKTLDQENAEC